MRRSASAIGLVALVGAVLLVTAAPALAACHIAAFVEPQVEGEETVGTVALIVELQGRVGSCAGTVDFATVDGTAVAGEDYEAASGTLTFVENDDRVETIDLVLIDDGLAEDPEQFTVELSNPTGSLGGTGSPATVVIAGGGGQGTQVGEGIGGDQAEVEDAAADPLEVERGGNGLIIAVIALAVVGLGAFVGLRGRG